MSLSQQSLFNKLSKAVYEYRFFMFLFFIVLILLSVIGASSIVMETGTDTYIDSNSKLYRDLEMYTESFLSDSIVVVVEGQSVTDPRVLQAMTRTESLIEPIPGVDSVVSPATIIRAINENVTGRNEIPSTQEEVDALLAYAPPEFYKLVSDPTHCMIITSHGNLTTDQETSILYSVKDSVEFAQFPPGYTTIITGNSALAHDMSNEIVSGLVILIGLAIVLMFIALSFLFKGVRWRLYPLLVVLLGIAFTFGLMGFLQLDMTMVSIAAFPILIGLGIDYAIQFQNRFEEEIRNGHSGKKALEVTFTTMGPAVFTALIVTAVSFLSLLTSITPMVRGFGLLLIIGCIVCYFTGLLFGTISIYFFNAISNRVAKKKEETGKDYRILSFIFPQHTKDSSDTSDNFITKYINKWVGFAIRNKSVIIAIALVSGTFGFYLDSTIPAETDYKTYIPQDMPALINYFHLKSVQGGTDELNLLITADDYASPVLLKWMDDFSNYEIENQIYVEGTSSIAQIVKEKNGGIIPDSRDEILAIYGSLSKETMDAYTLGTNLLLLNLEMGDSLSTFSMESTETFIEVIKDDIAWLNPPPGVSITVTGGTVPFIDLMNSLLSGRTQQTAMGIVLVFIVLLILYKDVYRALAPIIPMTIVIGWSGIVMSVFGIVYTPMTSVLGCMVLGVGAEYSILLMERFFEEKEKFSAIEDAMKSAATSTGIALIVSGLTTTFGFLALVASSFPIISSFGAVTVINMVMTILASFTIFPPLMIEFDRIKESGGMISYLKIQKSRVSEKKYIGASKQ